MSKKLRANASRKIENMFIKAEWKKMERHLGFLLFFHLILFFPKYKVYYM